MTDTGSPTIGQGVLGIDAGGTGTRGVLLVEDKVVERFIGGPMNALLHNDVAERISTWIVRADPAVAGIGLPGLRSPTLASKMSSELSQATSRPVVVRSDIEAALFGAFLDGNGVVVVAGTGAIAMGRVTVDGRVRLARAGGHGFLLGDEGGGYWIGREAISAALRYKDGTGPQTTAGEVIAEVFGTNLDDVVAAVHQAPSDRTAVSRLVPHLAELDDEVIHDIFKRAAVSLAHLALSVLRKLDAGPVPVAPVGGVFHAKAIAEPFQLITGAVTAAQQPDIGAARMARQLTPNT